MNLFFLRHGIAYDREEWSGDDFHRPLTDAGRDKMTHEAGTIASLDLKLDVIITSPLVRAFQTAEIVAKKLKLVNKLVKDDRLGTEFNFEKLGSILKEHRKADAIMLVGHDPSFSEIIGELIGGARVVCKKGGLAYIELPDNSSLKGELIWLLPPKVLAP